MPGDRWGEAEQVPLVNAGQQCSCPSANLCTARRQGPRLKVPSRGLAPCNIVAMAHLYTGLGPILRVQMTLVAVSP